MQFKFLPIGVINNNSALVWVMACLPHSLKPLLDPVMTQFTDAYAWWHQAISWTIGDLFLIEPSETNFETKYKTFVLKKMAWKSWKCSFQNGGNLILFMPHCVNSSLPGALLLTWNNLNASMDK